MAVVILEQSLHTARNALSMSWLWKEIGGCVTDVTRFFVSLHVFRLVYLSTFLRCHMDIRAFDGGSMCNL